MRPPRALLLAGAAVIVAAPIAPPPDVQIPAVQNAAGAEPLPSDAIWQKSPIVYEAIFDPARIEAIIAVTDVLADPVPSRSNCPTTWSLMRFLSAGQ